MEGRGRYGHGVTGDRAPEVSVVILTTGARPLELRAAVDSALRQDGPIVEVVVVANGTSADLGLPSDDRVRIVSSAENLGIPGGRNLGATQAVAPLVAFLDDDARLIEVDALAASAARLRGESTARRRGAADRRRRRSDRPSTRSPSRRPRCRSERSGDRLPGWCCRHPPRSVRAGWPISNRLPICDGRDRSRPAPRRRRLDDPATRALPRWSTRGPIRRGIPTPRRAPCATECGSPTATFRRHSPSSTWPTGWSSPPSGSPARLPSCSRESAAAGPPGPGVNGPRSAGAPSFG